MSNYNGNFYIFGRTGFISPKIVIIDQHLALKKYILFVITLFMAVTVRAQSGYNYYEWGVGAGASYERGYTNITTQYNHPAFNVSAVYNYSPYLPVEAEIQIGTLSGGGLSPKQDPYGRMYTNKYKALILHADFQVGSAIDYEGSWILNIVKNFYGGTGIGFIANSNTVQRYSIYRPAPPNANAYKFPGSDSGIGPTVPIRFGYEFKIYDDYNQPSIAIDIGYIHSFVFGEGLDGYNDPPDKFKNNAIDQYRQVTLGVKFFFGTTVSYNKLIRTFRY
jgi:hypothetical protein